MKNRIAHLLPDPFAYDDSEVGLHYPEHRHFDPTVGRWLSDDPAGFDDTGTYQGA